LRTPSVSTGVIAGVLLLATAAGAQPIPQANPYASCIAQASPHYGSFMTIDDLRAYMAEHPDCQNGGNSPSQIKPPVPLPPRTSSGLTYNDVPAMVAAYKQNEVRFKRDYVGRQFSDRLKLERVSNGNGITSDTRTRINFGNVHCYVTTGSVPGVTSWNQGDLVEVWGIVKDVWFSTVELEQCVFRRPEASVRP
jgi:hypothetical protein